MNQARSEMIHREGRGIDSQERGALQGEEEAALTAATDTFDRPASCFAVAAVRCVPAWLRIIGGAPWWEGAASPRRIAHRPILELYKQQASVYGLSLGLRIDPARPDADRIRACLRAGLIHWQTALDPQGRPVAVRRRGSRLWSVVVQQVLRSIEELESAQRGELFDDIAAHLDWLRRHEFQDACWVESALIESLAGGALMLRDPNLHRLARERLPGLLHRQSAEGWFQERGGADVGRLSLTLDALARLYFDHDWGELFEPLERGIHFLSLLVHANGSGGGCYGSCDTAFVSPYALLRFSGRIREAALIAEHLRRRLERNLLEVPTVWHDNITAVLGSAIAAAAVVEIGSDTAVSSDASTSTPAIDAPDQAEVEPPKEKHLAESRLTLVRRKGYRAIVAGRRGGAVQVHWLDQDRVVDYPGITVLFAHTIRTSRVQGAGYGLAAEHGAMSWRGILLKAGSRKTPWWRRVWAATIGNLWRRRSGSVSKRFETDTSRGRHRLLHDWFAREIVFADKEITIRDQILTRLPPDAVVLGSSIGEDRWVDRCGENVLRDGPIVVEGGRALTITRVYRDSVLASLCVERHADFL